MEHHTGEASYQSLVQEATDLMQKKLPEYVVHAFVAAGFDTLQDIAAMDVSDSPTNSLSVIERYISEAYPNDPRFVNSTLPSGMFKFPPGHWQRIERCIAEVKDAQQKRLCLKRGSGCNDPSMPKRARIATNLVPGGDSSSTGSSQEVDQAYQTGEVRRLVVRWQRSQCIDKLKELKEHEHFEVKVLAGGTSILCKVCGKCISLAESLKVWCDC